MLSGSQEYQQSGKFIYGIAQRGSEVDLYGKLWMRYLRNGFVRF